MKNEQRLKKVVPINTVGGGVGVAKTVLSGYYKYGVQTLLTGNFGTTGTIIMEIYGNTEDTAGDQEGIH